MIRPRFLVLLISALGMLALSLPAAASAASPWWSLETGSRATNIDPDAGHPAEPEQQEIVLHLEGGAGAFELGVGANLEQGCGSGLGCFVYPQEEAENFGLPAATPAELQTALEGPYGAGHVTVTENLSGETVSFLVSHPTANPLSIAAVGIGTPELELITHGARAQTDGVVFVSAENVGNADFPAGTQISDVLPAGLEAVGIDSSEPGLEGNFNGRRGMSCDLATLTCTAKHPLAPFDNIQMQILVDVVGPVTEPNQARALGAGATPLTISRPLTVSSDPTPFGVQSYEMALEEEGGAPLDRAAAHPFQFTTQIALNQGPLKLSVGDGDIVPVGLPKDVDFNLPPGLIGNPAGLARCTYAEFFTIINDQKANACPPDSAVGAINVLIDEPELVHAATIPEPIFNLEPTYGEPARFGFYVILAGAPVFIDTEVRSGPGQDYGITARADNIIQNAAFFASTATFWGTPGAAGHDGQRGWGCMLEARNVPDHLPCSPSTQLHPRVVFTAPTRCDAPLQTGVDANSWGDRTFVHHSGSFLPSEALEACGQVPFAPQIDSKPTSDAATSPTGLSFDIEVNDEGLQNPGGLAQSQIKRTVVTLPQGFTTNPSVAEGLKACSQAEFEAATIQEGTGCLPESKVGDVEIQSPLIAANSEGITPKVTGSLFVARQGLNPYHNLLTLYLIARSPELGVLVRQALKVTPNPKTGQLTTEVDNIPELPFSKFHLEFRTGQRAPLITPPTCGTYIVNADLYPYSEPENPLRRESSFQITQGPEGQPCPSGNTPPFHPNLEAGTINNRAGSYSPFYTHISRKDSEQEITHFSIKLPPGVIGKLAGVAQCSDASIAAAKAREHEGGGGEEEASPSCPTTSQVGRSLVGSGVGNVLAYAPGKIYLAGPYHGSAISLVSITAAKVGPFDLGTVVVRFALRIDPETAEVFVDATGSDPIPHIVDGIPVHLRDIRAYVDRPEFTLNPTGCEKTSTASTVLGSGLDFVSEADDQPVTVSSPFQAADCAALSFDPKLKLSLIGGTKRGDTPKFKAVLTAKPGESNIARAQVTLPHSEFLDNAHIKTICTRVQYRAEQCPANSVYGYAKAITPILSEPIEGPVYLRSSEHKLPDLVAKLKNGEITIDLVGHIDSVGGRIRNTFEAVPDAPVSKFTLEMQGGKKGLLENSTNLCATTHRAIADFDAHNGKAKNFTPALVPKCAKGRKGKKGHKHHRAG